MKNFPSDGKPRDERPPRDKPIPPDPKHEKLEWVRPANEWSSQ
jgi:hypothetical protein